MSRFTENDFETAFREVYPTEESHFSKECKTFLKDILTSDLKNLDEYIRNISISKSGNEAMIACINSIMGNTNIDELKTFIFYINGSSVTSATILEIMAQQHHHSDIPILKVCLQMLKNQEEQRLLASARPLASAPPSERPLASALPSARTSALPSARTSAPASAPASAIAKPAKPRIARPSALPSATAKPAKPTPLSQNDIKTYKEKAEYNNPDEWYTQSPNNELQYYIHKMTNLRVTPDEYRQIVNIQRGGGSRRRRSSHRKRKSYRKSKRVRHTRRKQTRRHRRSKHRR